MNYQPVVAGNQPNSSAGIQENLNAGTVRKEANSVQQYVLLPFWSSGSKDPRNTDAAAFEVKEPESVVHVSPSSCDKKKKHDDKTKREAKGKKFFDNSTNDVNAANTSVIAVGPNLTNSTNTFSVAGPFNNVGHTQEEGIDYEEVFAPVARIEAIRLFMAYASFMGFMVYQMDVKSASLYGTIEEELYVCQPLGFKDPDYLDKVYKVVKALYGLHQALRAWYKTLASYLLENGFQQGKIDQTLFIKKQKGLQVNQKQDGLFISQDKYVAEILKKFGLIDGKSASTPTDTEKPLLKDPNGKYVDVHTYRSMIGSLMYLTTSRPDIMFDVYAYARF
nr:hypothetical protein [Tanacetum cinerariifolium]